MEKKLVEIALEKVKDELEEATELNNSFNSAHEGYAVILEELDELWDEVKKKRKERDEVKMHDEAKQVAAMAIRFMIDICPDSTRFIY